MPVMSAPREGVPVDLPFPSLVDWDSFALFTDNFDAISKVVDPPFTLCPTLNVSTCAPIAGLFAHVPLALVLMAMHVAGGRRDRSHGKGAGEARGERGGPEAA